MIDFIGKKYYCFALSAIIFVIGLVSFAVNGFVMDVDFKGGTIIEVNMGAEFDSVKLASVAKEAIGKDVTIQKIGSAKQQAAIKAEPLTSEERDKLFEAVKEEYNLTDEAKLRVSDVQPLMGEEMRNKGFWASVIASLLILVYIAFRFRKVSGFVAGATAVIALVHDLFVMCTVYSLFGIPVNGSFVAAVLTILGYSINDTIIVYDRIRENQALYKKMTFAELVNRSLNQTLSRTLNTVVTLVLAVLCLYIASVYYAVQSIEEFTFPMLVGLASGSYSSLFIASQLWVVWNEFSTRKKVVTKSAKA